MTELGIATWQRGANWARGLLLGKYYLLTVMLLALGLRLAWILLVKTVPAADAAWYFDRGVELALGKGYVVHDSPTAYWPIGYPAFLGMLFRLAGPSVFVAELANVLLSLGALGLAYLLCRRLFNSELTGRMTLLILALSPNFIAYSSLLLSEVLFTFLLLLGAWLALMRPGRRWFEVLAALASGAVFGLAALVRPQVLFVPIIVALCLSPRYLRIGRWVWLALAYLAFGAVLLPWTIRNYTVFQHFVFISTNGGINLWIGNGPAATGGYNWEPWQAAATDSLPTEYDRDQYARQQALTWMASHPVETIRLWAAKLNYLWGDENDGYYENTRDEQTHSPSVRRALDWVARQSRRYYWFIIATAIVGAVLLVIGRSSQGPLSVSPWLGLGMVLYFTLVSLIFFGGSRFHFPAMPWVAMYAGMLWEVLLKRFHSSTDLEGQQKP